MDDTAFGVIGILYIHLALEVLNCGEEAVFVGVPEAVTVRILCGDQRITVIAEKNGTACAVGYGFQIAFAIVGERKGTSTCRSSERSPLYEREIVFPSK